ncbi:LysR family transcriptional regulator [Mixta intestinalis]|jgi:DNA-binding transcriptional LysR family regulator|uniref:Hca operon transcriptional activator HcaR n=1 Tax=Mixta intestinalis TaxID=1615494 RepID=A0A6P1PVW6_9GAMM|nr:LysR family transcriptional regulator [Mixta intestinalis]QHM70184.1 Hca operon transcriptional activator HcaR [Mixta intestinalis]
MRYSPESLQAFVQTVESGSFSAAARALGKSQSTVSAAIANLETDLGFQLFHREGREPVLTEAGIRALRRVEDILAASQRLDELAVRLSGDVEPRLSMAVSDFWQADHHEQLLKEFEVRYPHIELECMLAEDEDVIELLKSGRSHLGVIRAQKQLPATISASRLQMQAQMEIFIHRNHPLAHQMTVSQVELEQVRQLKLNTWVGRENMSRGPVWTAPSYLLLLEMAELEFGWSILPRWLVKQFGHGVLVTLPVAGWPQSIALEVVWSTRTPPGPAGRWMIDRLCAQRA